MIFGEPSNFTIFVLMVSIVLSFTLRKLIQDIQILKEKLQLDLSNFTKDLVEDHPTLEKYRKLALMYFGHEMYESSMSYFDRLLHEKVFLREARYYKVVCLVRLNRDTEALEMYRSLDLAKYSTEEVNLMRGLFSRQNPLVRSREALLRILLTNVHFQYLPQRTHPSTREAEIERVITSLPTRYTNVQLKAEQEHFYVFNGYDQHLERQVRLQVENPSSQSENFLDYPKILARLDSRFFPEVYDLQQSGLIYYSLELFEGDNLFDVFGVYRREGRLEDTLRLWIYLLGSLRFLAMNGVFLAQFDLSEIGLHSRKNNLFFSGALCDYAEDQVSQIQTGLIELLLVNLKNALSDMSESESMEIVQNGIEQIEQVSYAELSLLIEDIYSKLITFRQKDSRQFIEQLGQIEKIHRSCIHGLKGKYSITRRYQDDPLRLKDTFFRKSNIEDISLKVARLKQYCEELRAMSQHQAFGISSDLLALDLDRLLHRQNQLYELFQQKNDSQIQEAVSFLIQQYDLFSRLSDEQSQFIRNHEMDMVLLLGEFCNSYIERQISLEYSPAVRSCKVRVLDRAEFHAKVLIVLENLANNAFEAGATDLRLNLYLNLDQLVLEVRDNGPGIAEGTLSELRNVGNYSLEYGGTGLLASRNICQSLSIDFEAKSLSENLGSQINLSFAIYKI